MPFIYDKRKGIIEQINVQKNFKSISRKLTN